MKTNCSLTYCLSRLTPAEYVVYLACCELWCGLEMNLNAKAIAPVISMTHRTVCRHLRCLRKKGFILHDTTQQQETVFFWVRTTEAEIAPKLKNLRYRGAKVVLRSPEGKIHKIRFGYYEKFCAEHGLCVRNFNLLVKGDSKSYLGWTLVSAA